MTSATRCAMSHELRQAGSFSDSSGLLNKLASSASRGIRQFYSEGRFHIARAFLIVGDKGTSRFLKSQYSFLHRFSTHATFFHEPYFVPRSSALRNVPFFRALMKSAVRKNHMQQSDFLKVVAFLIQTTSRITAQYHPLCACFARLATSVISDACELFYPFRAKINLRGPRQVFRPLGRRPHHSTHRPISPGAIHDLIVTEYTQKMKILAMPETMHQARTPWRRISVFLAMGLLVVSSGFGAEAKGVAVTNCIRQVDHIVVASSRAKELFALLTESFELPVAWPMAEYGTFASGGVSLGNVNLEVIQASESGGVLKTYYTGLALEPEPLDSVLPLLAARSISHGDPAPFRKWEGLFPKKLWTTVSLRAVSSDGLSVFLCEYELDTAARRQKLNAELRERNGGPLTVLSVREVVIGTEVMAEKGAEKEREWEKLLVPAKQDSSESGKLLKFGEGPAIRLVPTERTGIPGLVIEVRSIAEAREFLKGRMLEVTERDGALELNSALLKDLNIRLVPARK